MKTLNKNTKNIIISALLAVVATVLTANFTAHKAYADCQPNYGGGQNCVFTGRFSIEKWVKLEDDNSWKDEVTIDLNDDDEKDKRVLFKVKVTADVTNASGVDVNSIDFDEMKMKDKWPDELKFLEDESQDDLTEEWDNFKPGESKTFYFTGKIRDSEKEKDGEFEKCVVNKATLYYKDDSQGSDDAVVCYKKGEDVLGASTELPKTGVLPLESIAGLVLVGLGTVLKVKSKKA